MRKITTLRDETRTMLNNRPAHLTIDEIAIKVDVSPQWLRLLARGKIDDPGVIKIQTLYQFLKNYKSKA